MKGTARFEPRCRTAAILLTLCFALVLAPAAASGETAIFLTTNAPSGNNVSVYDYVVVGDLLFFSNAGETGRELWKTDGTPAGTLKIADIPPGDPSAGGTFYSARGLLFFMGGLGAEARLWKSDGTPEGTTPVTDLAIQRILVAQDDGLIFQSDDGSVWITDGTAAGTMLFEQPPAPPYPVTVNGTSFFASVESGSGTLWITDGTDAGTLPIADLGSCDAAAVLPVSLFTADGQLEDWAGPFFTSYCTQLHSCFECLPTTKSQLWATDGSAGGTVSLIDPPSAGIAIFPDTVLVGDTFFFQTDQAAWISDGTPAGTTPLVAGFRSGDPIAMPGRVFLRLETGGQDQLWVSDGTAGGTVPLAPFNASEFARVRKVAFLTEDLPTARALWRTDGTPPGTRPLDLGLDAAGAYASILGAPHGALVFSTDNDPFVPTLRNLWVLSDCASTEDCDDADPCTVDACVNGVCFDRALPAMDEMLCRVRELVAHPLCRGRVSRGVRRSRAKLRRLERRARRLTGSIRAAAVGRIDAQLARLGSRASAAAGQRRITAGCAAAIDASVAKRRQLIAGLPP